MAPKNSNEGRAQRSKTLGQTSEADPNPTTTFPSASTPTGDATTASLFPSSASPSAPPTTTTTTQLIPSTPPPTTFLLPISPIQITATTQPLPSPQPLPIRVTSQERISCTSDGATTTDGAGLSTAPSASAASTDDFMSLHASAFEHAMAAVQSVNEEESTPLHDLYAILFGCRLPYMEPVIKGLLKVAELMKGDAELKAALEALADVEFFKSTIREAKMVLAEGKKPDGSGGSCSGSKGAGGGPDGGGSGEGDGNGEGGGVGV